MNIILNKAKQGAKQMKQILKYILLFIFIIIILPNLCTKKRKQSKNEENIQVSETENKEETTYEYSKYKTIKLYHTKTNQVEELLIDEYLYGVVSGEMPADYEMEALKAQAIVARTYTIYQISKNKRKTSRWRYM